MATTLDTKMRAVALRLIDNFGATAILHIPVAHQVDTASATVQTATRRIEAKMSPPFPNREGQDSGIGTQALVSYIAASGLAAEPVPETRVEFQGATYRVVGVQVITSGEQKAAFALELAR